MDAAKAIELATKNGIALVLCFVMVAILVWVLKWVFETTRIREKALAEIVNVAMANLTVAQRETSLSIQKLTDGIQAMSEANKDIAKYQREEHSKILDAVKDGECKAK